MSQMSQDDPALLSRPVFTCQLDFACYSAKLASEGLSIQTRIQQRQQQTTEQAMPQTSNATGRKMKAGEGNFFLLVWEDLFIALPWLCEGRALSPARQRGENQMFLPVLG